MKWYDVVRLFGELGLVYMCYLETGPWTCFMLAMLMALHEVSYVLHQLELKAIKKLLRGAL